MTTYANVGHILLKRGNTTQSTTHTGPVGELTFDTGLNTVRAHNGSTVGGILLATNDQSLAANANVGAFQTYANLTFSTQANAATQATLINAINANITAANAAITSLTSNAAIQASILDTLTGNATTQAMVLDTLTSNAATQATTLTTLLSNAVTQQTSLTDLVANAATQAEAIANAVGTYSNSNVKSYFDSFDGNILPAANVTYSLGSSTRQWRDLWVSNNTIYIGNTPIRVDSGTLLVNGAPVGSNYGNANVATYLPTYTGNIAGNIVKNGYAWTFGSGGNLTVPAGGIITAPNSQEFRLQARDTNSLLRNEIELDPNNGTYMSVQSEELETSYNTSDWATGSWENLVGVPGISGAFFTNAENLQDFWTTGSGSFVDSVEVSINGGARLPVSYDGNNGETYGALLLLTGVPATSPTTITSLTFYYRTKSSIDIDYNEGEILLDAQSIDIDLRTTNNLDLRAGQNLNLRGTGQYPVRIYTNDNTHIWEFDNTGSLTLPSEGKIYGIGTGPAGDRLGYISWAGNTSGDGSGYNTIRLVPDLQGLEDVDQYIIIDPTGGVPGHIHIRAGGTQDNSLAHLYLGGENSHVKIGAGLNPPVTVMANTHSWTFSTNGALIFPDATVQSTAWTGILPSPTYSGSDAIGNVPPAPLNLNNTGTSGQLKTQLTLINTAGGGGTGSAIDFFTYTDVGSGFPGARIQSIDDSNYSADLSIILKEPGSGDNTDGATWAFGANANLTLPQTGYLRVGSGIVAGFASSPAPVISGFSSVSAENFRFQGNGVNILSTVGAGSYGNANVANYLNNGINTSSNINAYIASSKFVAYSGGYSGYSEYSPGSLSLWTNYATGSYTNLGQQNGLTLLDTVVYSSNTMSRLGITTNSLTYGAGSANIGAPTPAFTVTSTGNVQATNYQFANGVNILSTVGAGAYGNTQVATYLLNFDGDIEFTSSTAKIGNVDVITVMDSIQSPAYRFSNGASILSGVVSKTTGSWTVTTGTNTYSFTVPTSGTYQLWVDCNIPNGIIAWNATATVTNSNVPVVGQQFAWVYNGNGTPIDFVSIPNQFTGTANTIVRGNVAPSATTNRFDFGINNTSGGNVTASYGWIQIS